MLQAGRFGSQLLEEECLTLVMQPTEQSLSGSRMLKWRRAASSCHSMEERCRNGNKPSGLCPRLAATKADGRRHCHWPLASLKGPIGRWSVLCWRVALPPGGSQPKLVASFHCLASHITTSRSQQHQHRCVGNQAQLHRIKLCLEFLIRNTILAPVGLFSSNKPQPRHRFPTSQLLKTNISPADGYPSAHQSGH